MATATTDPQTTVVHVGGQFKPGFKMDPYRPANRGDPQGYCPENVDPAGVPVPNDFPHEATAQRATARRSSSASGTTTIH
jgi:hypothetical protein